jgi:LCP family protein required for cell wall assembly
VIGGVAIGLGIWLFLGYRAFSDSVAKANRRFDRITRRHPVRPLLDPVGGLVLNNPTTILVLGRDRTGRSDSIQIIRTDPGKHLVSTLAIPRDLRVAIDGHEQDKINAAYAFGGPALALRTVRAFTGLKINHVVLVDFAGVVRLVNAVGGIDIVSSERLRSDFDGHVYSFPKGPVHLTGREALAYARIRKNQYNASDSDVTRGVRQQQVMQALKHKLATPGTLLRLRSVGARAADPLATDLSAFELIQLGWVDFRSDRHLQCHLGGTPADIAGVSFLQPVPENRTVLDEFLGNVAVAAADRSNPFAPGCTTVR